jgi:hypothetical protein
VAEAAVALQEAEAAAAVALPGRAAMAAMAASARSMAAVVVAVRMAVALDKQLLATWAETGEPDLQEIQEARAGRMDSLAHLAQAARGPVAAARTSGALEPAVKRYSPTIAAGRAMERWLARPEAPVARATTAALTLPDTALEAAAVKRLAALRAEASSSWNTGFSGLEAWQRFH